MKYSYDTQVKITIREWISVAQYSSNQKKFCMLIAMSVRILTVLATIVIIVVVQRSAAVTNEAEYIINAVNSDPDNIWKVYTHACVLFRKAGPIDDEYM